MNLSSINESNNQSMYMSSCMASTINHKIKRFKVPSSWLQQRMETKNKNVTWVTHWTVFWHALCSISIWHEAIHSAVSTNCIFFSETAENFTSFLLLNTSTLHSFMIARYISFHLTSVWPNISWQLTREAANTFCQGCCCLLSYRASLYFGDYQIILLCDRGMCVNNLPTDITLMISRPLA